MLINLLVITYLLTLIRHAFKTYQFMSLIVNRKSEYYIKNDK